MKKDTSMKMSSDTSTKMGGMKDSTTTTTTKKTKKTS
jgi:hypothetical protein